MKTKAELPLNYDNYVFDLYGTLVDIRTNENKEEVWERLAMFYGYYGALYESEGLKNAYKKLVSGKELALKSELADNPKYEHESSPEIEITDVFMDLYKEKGVEASHELAVHTGQFFRVLATDFVRLYPGTKEMLSYLKEAGKKVYLLSNAQRIFTEYELRCIDIFKYFDAVLISSDYKTKKPDKRFFDALIEKEQLDSRKTIYIGNDSKNDIEGARQVDFATFYVKSDISPANDSAPMADYSVDDFTEWNYK